MNNAIESMHMGFAGHVSWQVLNADGSIDSQGEHKNLILDSGLDRIGVAYIVNCFTHAVVGTGTVAPVVSNTLMGVERARTSTYPTFEGANGTSVLANVLTHKRTFTFPIGSLNSAVQGDYSEIGFGWSATANSATLFSRSLFKDVSNNPTPITVSSVQELRVVYTLTVTRGNRNWTDGTIEVSGIGTVPYKVRANLTSFSGSPTNTGSYPFANQFSAVSIGGHSDASIANGINIVCGEPYVTYISYPQVNFANMVLPYDQIPTVPDNNLASYFNPTIVSQSQTNIIETPVYTNGSFYIDKKLPASTSQAIFSINYIFLCGQTSMARDAFTIIHFPTPIVKDNLHTLSLTLRQTWGRA